MSSNIRMMNKSEIDNMMAMYFHAVRYGHLRDALSLFAKKQGYGQEVIFVTFLSDLDADDQAELPSVLDDKHVLLELDAPAVDVDQRAYVDFPTFYGCLSKHITRIVNKFPEETDLLELLAKVKVGLGI